MGKFILLTIFLFIHTYPQKAGFETYVLFDTRIYSHPDKHSLTQIILPAHTAVIVISAQGDFYRIKDYGFIERYTVFNTNELLSFNKKIFERQKEYNGTSKTSPSEIKTGKVISNEITTEQKETKYVGSKNSDKYHLTSCRWANKISPENLIEFNSIQDVEDAGYIPCKICNPSTLKESTESINKTTTNNQTIKSETNSSGRCLAITKKGTQCKRNAQEGSDYCWQHQDYNNQ